MVLSMVLMLGGDCGAAEGLGCRMGPAAFWKWGREGLRLCW